MLKILVIIIAVIGFVVWFYHKNPLSAKIRISDAIYSLELAITASEKMQGLSDRKSMARDHGMLFLYDHKEQYSFWMKGMQFPLDFLWIDGNTIVDITENWQPATRTNRNIVTPRQPVDKILELNAGEVTKHRFKVGDTVVFLD